MTARYHSRMYFLPPPELAAHLLHVPQGGDLALEVHRRDVQAFDQVLGRGSAGLLQDLQYFYAEVRSARIFRRDSCRRTWRCAPPTDRRSWPVTACPCTIFAEDPAELLSLFPFNKSITNQDVQPKELYYLKSFPVYRGIKVRRRLSGGEFPGTAGPATLVASPVFRCPRAHRRLASSSL